MKKKIYLFVALAIAMLLALGACEGDQFIEEGFIPEVDIDTEEQPSGDKMENPYYEWVATFPGHVGDSVPRLKNHEVVITPDFTQWSALRIAYAPIPWHSTGLYAAPADIVTIDVPTGIEGVVKCRLGVWTCKLKNNAQRPPVIWKEITLKKGENKVFNYFGGNIYLTFDTPSKTPYTFTFSNAVATTDFIVGETDFSKWKEDIKNTKVPWAEVRAKHMILTLPVEKLRKIEDPAVLMEWYEEFLTKDYNELWGLSEGNSDVKHRSPDAPWRMTTDIELCGGSAHAGYPFIASSSWGDRATDLEHMQKSDWGIYHELGHNYQTYNWKPGYFVEVTCNIHVYHMHNRKYNDWPSKDKFVDFNWGVNNWISDGDDNATDGRNFSQLYSSDGPHGQKLITMVLPFIQLAQKYGWKYLTYVNKASRELDVSGSMNDAERMDFFMRSVTQYAGVNLMPFFDAWGMRPSSKFVRQYIEQYDTYTDNPFWDVFDESIIPDLETYRTPVIKPEIEAPVKLDETKWSVIAESGTSPDGSSLAGNSSKLFDGNDNTFWVSNKTDRPIYSDKYGPRPFVEINLNGKCRLTDVRVVTRNHTASHLHLKKFLLKGKLNESDEWTTIGTYIVPGFAFKEYKIELNSPVEVGFLYLEGIEGHPLSGGGTNTGAMCTATFGAYGNARE